MAVSVVSFSQVANWFNSTTPKTVTGISWSAGDVIVVVGGRENCVDSSNTPTNANLTFSLQASITSGAGTESAAYVWTATAATGQTGQTISASATGATNWGFACWVLTGTSGSVANASANRTESAFSITPTVGSAVVYYLSDWNANATDQTLATGTGTGTERVDNTDSASYANYAGEWVDVTASTTSFGITSYSGLQVGHVVIEILAVAGTVADTTPFSPSRVPGLIGPDGQVFIPGPRLDLSMVAAEVLASVDPADLTLSGVDITAAGSGSASVSADVATFVFSGVDPTLAGTGAGSVTADVGTLTISGLTPALAGTGSSSTIADVAILTFTGVDVTASAGSTVTADTATLTLAGVDTTLVGSGSSSTATDVATLTLTGLTPTLAGSGSASVTSDVATLVLSGVDISVSAGAQITADTATLTLTGVTPTITGTGSASTTPDVAALALIGVMPALAGTGGIARTADTAILFLTGVDVSAFTGQLVTPDVRTLMVTYAPRVVAVLVEPRVFDVPADPRILLIPGP